MSYVLAAYDARGRFLSAVRQSAPSGTSRRGFETPGLRLLVTDSIHYTIKIRLRRFTAEAQIQDRSRTKTGPNTAPGFSRVSNPIHSLDAEAGSLEKTQHPHHPLSRSAGEG